MIYLGYITFAAENKAGSSLSELSEEAVSWAAVLILPQIKFNLQLSKQNKTKHKRPFGLSVPLEEKGTQLEKFVFKPLPSSSSFSTLWPERKPQSALGGFHS